MGKYETNTPSHHHIFSPGKELFQDESLQRYKAALLGSAASGNTGIVVLPDDPRNVIVQKIWLVVEGRDDQELDLTKPLSEIKKTKFTLKEGIKLRTRIEFIVQR